MKTLTLKHAFSFERFALATLSESNLANAVHRIPHIEDIRTFISPSGTGVMTLPLVSISWVFELSNSRRTISVKAGGETRVGNVTAAEVNASFGKAVDQLEAELAAEGRHVNVIGE